MRARSFGFIISSSFFAVLVILRWYRQVGLQAAFLSARAPPPGALRRWLPGAHQGAQEVQAGNIVEYYLESHSKGNRQEEPNCAPQPSPHEQGQQNYNRTQVQSVASKFWVHEVANYYLGANHCYCRTYEGIYVGSELKVREKYGDQRNNN